MSTRLSHWPAVTDTVESLLPGVDGKASSGSEQLPAPAPQPVPVAVPVAPRS